MNVLEFIKYAFFGILCLSALLVVIYLIFSVIFTAYFNLKLQYRKDIIKWAMMEENGENDDEDDGYMGLG